MLRDVLLKESKGTGSTAELVKTTSGFVAKAVTVHDFVRKSTGKSACRFENV